MTIDPPVWRRGLGQCGRPLEGISGILREVSANFPATSRARSRSRGRGIKPTPTELPLPDSGGPPTCSTMSKRVRGAAAVAVSVAALGGNALADIQLFSNTSPDDWRLSDSAAFATSATSVQAGHLVYSPAWIPGDEIAGTVAPQYIAWADRFEVPIKPWLQRTATYFVRLRQPSAPALGEFRLGEAITVASGEAESSA